MSRSFVERSSHTWADADNCNSPFHFAANSDARGLDLTAVAIGIGGFCCWIVAPLAAWWLL